MSVIFNPPLDFEGRGTGRRLVEGPSFPAPAKAGEDL